MWSNKELLLHSISKVAQLVSVWMNRTELIYMFVKTISNTDKQFMEINVYFTKREFKWKYNFRKMLLVTQKRGVWVVLSSAVNAQLWHSTNEENTKNTKQWNTKMEFCVAFKTLWFKFTTNPILEHHTCPWVYLGTQNCR